MKILFVSDVSIHRVIGGAERVLYEQTTGLARRNHQVYVLTRRLPEHPHENETIEGVQEWRYNVDQASNLRFFLSTLAYGLRLFDRLQKESRFDCINGHQPFSTWAAIRSPACAGIPFVYTCHSLSFEEFITRAKSPDSIQERLSHSLNISLRKWIEKRVLKAARRIVVLSEFTRDKLMKIYHLPENKITIIPGGVDIGRFQPLPDRKTARRLLGLPIDPFLLFTVRNLVPRMGLENLLRAMKDIVNVLPDTYLVLGGSGPLRESMHRLVQELGIEDHVRFAGFIPENDLPAYFGMADAFVLPTVALEGFGLVTVEALACGTPALGTPVGGTVEILCKLDPLLIFQNTSPAAISSSIIDHYQKWRQNQESYEAFRRQCRQFAESNYSWEKNIIGTEALFSGFRQ